LVKELTKLIRETKKKLSIEMTSTIIGGDDEAQFYSPL
jgi:hypothetical protein